MYPRDAAGSFTLPPGSVGAITEMCSLVDFMEIYTPHETFKVQSPESIDPGRTNPNAMWAMVRTHQVGSESPIVARTLLMAHRSANLLQPLSGEKSLTLAMHGVKETLLEVLAVAQTLLDSIAGQAKAVTDSGFRLAANGRSLETFPLVPDLNAKVTALLTTARRGVTEICQIPTNFMKVGRQHSSLDHLIAKELASQLPPHGLKFLEQFAPQVRRLIAWRDGLEHRITTTRKLVVRNFEHMPDNNLRLPSWQLEGEDPEPIDVHARELPSFLLDFAEGMFIACADATRKSWPPTQIEVVDPVDPKCPIRYRVSIDSSRLTYPVGEAMARKP